MIYLVGASSLRNTFEGTPYDQKRQLLGHNYFKSGLSFNNRNPDKTKVLQHLLDNGGGLASRRNILIWHDVINNTLTPHREISACPVSELVEILNKYKSRIAAIVYIKRFGSPDALTQLRTTGIIVIDAFRQLISHRNRKNHSLVSDLQRLHPQIRSEARILFVIWKRQSNLEAFGPKKFEALRSKPKKNKLSKKKRDQLKQQTL